MCWTVFLLGLTAAGVLPRSFNNNDHFAALNIFNVAQHPGVGLRIAIRWRNQNRPS